MLISGRALGTCILISIGLCELEKCMKRQCKIRPFAECLMKRLRTKMAKWPGQLKEKGALSRRKQPEMAAGGWVHGRSMSVCVCVCVCVCVFGKRDTETE